MYTTEYYSNRYTFLFSCNEYNSILNRINRIVPVFGQETGNHAYKPYKERMEGPRLVR